MLLNLVWALLLLGQSHALIQVDARLDRDRIALGQKVVYTITVQNASVDDYEMPDLADFVVLSGPNREESSTITAGQSMVATQISYELQPRKLGNLLIGPANLQLGGRIYRTNSRRLEVLPAGSLVEELAPNNFMRLEVDRSQAYVGQQIIVNLRVYTTVNRQGLNVVQLPSFDGFIHKARNKFDSRTKTVEENGKTYLAHTVESFALYPVRAGELVIEPYEYSMTVREYRVGANGFKEPFTDFIPLRSDTVLIQVEELPQPQPDNFSGGIGTFRMTTSVNRDTMTTDDALSLRMIISGEGDIFRVRQLLPAKDEDWDIYPPDVEVEDMMDSPTGYFGRKILEYQLVPKHPGRVVLSPAVVIFDPDSAAYITLMPERYEIAISAGDGQPTYDTSIVANAPEAVLSPSVERPRLQYPDGGVGRPIVYWALFLLPILAFGGLLTKTYLDQREERIDPAERAQSRAARAAYVKLRLAKKEANSQKSHALVEEALLNYPQQKWQQPLRELSKEAIRRGLVERQLGPDQAEAYINLIKNCELTRYAGFKQTAQQAPYQAARQLIEAIEKLDAQRKPATEV